VSRALIVPRLVAIIRGHHMEGWTLWGRASNDDKVAEFCRTLRQRNLSAYWFHEDHGAGVGLSVSGRLRCGVQRRLRSGCVRA
jgi:hypothetical protein